MSQASSARKRPAVEPRPAAAAATPDRPFPADGRRRVVIENARPCVEEGEFAVKRTTDESVVVRADVFTNGHGGRGAFIARAVLASTLCASWGVYGPAFELMEGRPAKPGSEEYPDSEKYQLRAWDLERADSLAPLLGTLNAIRRENAALQHDRSLRFHACDNPAIVCYSKSAGDNAIVVAVNTDPHRAQWGTVDLDLAALGVPEDHPYQMHDLLTNARYRWQGRRNVVALDPASKPAHVFRLRRQDRAEAQFECFL